MTSQWLSYLQSLETRFDKTGQQLRLSKPDAMPPWQLQGHYLSDLSDTYGVIEVSGEEAAVFLQGQFTNDMRQVNPSHSQLSAWCTPKGRVLVNFRVCQRGTAYYLLLPTDSLDSTLKRLRLYVLRAKVQLRHAEELICSGLSGADAAALLATCGVDAVPAEAHQSVTQGELTVIQVAAQPAQFLLLAPVATQQHCWNTLIQADVIPGTAASWQLLEVLAGRPQIGRSRAEAFIPQMLNLPQLGAVNFKKGCYTGQEIVARTQYLGQVKRRLFLGYFAETAALSLDTALCASHGATDSSGELVALQALPDGGSVCLAVLPVESAADFHLGSPTGPLLQLRELPYQVDAEAGA